jgi:hypothetical protein
MKYRNLTGCVLSVEPSALDRNSSRIQFVAIKEGRSIEDAILCAAFDVLVEDGRIGKKRVGDMAHVSHRKWGYLQEIYNKWCLAEWELSEPLPLEGHRFIVWSKEKLLYGVFFTGEYPLVIRPFNTRQWQVFISRFEDELHADTLEYPRPWYLDTEPNDGPLAPTATREETLEMIRRGYENFGGTYKESFMRKYFPTKNTG